MHALHIKESASLADCLQFGSVAEMTPTDPAALTRYVETAIKLVHQNEYVATAPARERELVKTQSPYPILKAGSRPSSVIMKAAKAAVCSNDSELSDAIYKMKSKNLGLILAAESDSPCGCDYFYADSKYIQTEEENRFFLAIYSQIKPTSRKKFVVTQKTWEPMLCKPESVLNGVI